MEFDVSRAQIEHASAVVAGGVNSAFRLGIRPHPLVFASADGPILTDVDGNQLIDYFLGMGPMLLGHRPPAVVEAARAQLDRSILVAGQTELEYAAARLLVELVPSAELVRFSVSGSEAVQVALRVARAATGRSTVVKFEGHYHGWFDNVLWSVAPDLSEAGPREAPVPLPGSAGQIPDRNISVLPWNDTEALRDRLGSGDVAAVIMEPVMFNSAGIVPAPGYLEAVREACDAAGTVLVFDEVITGFRVAPGGAQQRFGVLPDLTVLGKALASGFPVAALVGRRRYMNLVADRQVLHGGTYNTQSIAMAATLATLTQIRDGAPYRRIDQVGTRLMAGLREEFAAAGWTPGSSAIRPCSTCGSARCTRATTARRSRPTPRGTPTSRRRCCATGCGCCPEAPGSCPPRTRTAMSTPPLPRFARYSPAPDQKGTSLEDR